MAVASIPELVEPGNLYVPDDSFLSVNAGALPNGDDALTLTDAAGIGDFKAYQTSQTASNGESPHMLKITGATLSFWIRRRQAWGYNATALPASTGSTADMELLMGVYNAVGTTQTSTDKEIMWAVSTYGTTALQFVQLGAYNSGITPYYSSVDLGSALTLDTWHHIVVTRAAVTNFSVSRFTSQCTLYSYLDGQLMDANTSIYNSIWPNSDSTETIFSLGDGTAGGRTISGASPGAICDIGKITMYDRVITSTELLALQEAMIYGAAS